MAHTQFKIKQQDGFQEPKWQFVKCLRMIKKPSVQIFWVSWRKQGLYLYTNLSIKSILMTNLLGIISISTMLPWMKYSNIIIQMYRQKISWAMLQLFNFQMFIFLSQLLQLLRKCNCISNLPEDMVILLSCIQFMVLEVSQKLSLDFVLFMEELIC